MNNPYFSIIVPVYNVVNYVEKCVLSILCQSYNEFEIIIVDDGSTDGSGELCDELFGNRSNIKIVHQKNAGLSEARNSGIDYCSGNYIMFVDSDDELGVPDMLLQIANKIRQNDVFDIIQFPIIKYSEKGEILEKYSNIEFEAFGNKDFCLNFAPFRDTNLIAGSVCNKVFKKSIFDRRKFEKGRYHEDNLFLIDLLESNLNILCTKCGYYKYNVRSYSISTSKIKYNWLRDYFEVLIKRMLAIRKYETQSYICNFNTILNLLLYYNFIIDFNADKIWNYVADYTPEYKSLVKNILICPNYAIKIVLFKILGFRLFTKVFKR